MSTSLVPATVSTQIEHRWTRNETEAASNTASTLLEHAHIINLTFRVYMLELQRRSDSETSNAKQTNEGYTECM